MNSLNDIWSSVLAILSNSLTPTAMSTWFADCDPVVLTENTFVIHTTSDFKRDLIRERYGDLIIAALSDIFAAEIKLAICVGNELEDYIVEDTDTGDTLPVVAGYTFDNFIVGPSNKYAHAAAKAVSERPGSVYNPLFIYGNSGLGKTHLLLAIGQAIHHRTAEKSIVYVKGDDFTNDLVRAIGSGTTADFRAKYRSADLLLIDDIQFIAGKEQTQEEFFHTFNTLYEAGKQIVVTSDRPPVEMTKLEDRIRTRLEWGLMADVQPPDLETRMAIIRNKASQLALVIPDEVVEFIGKSITANIRQLEGVVKRLTAYRELLGETICVDTAKKAIADVIKVGVYIPTPQAIIEESARYYGVEPSSLTGPSRQKNVAMARQIAMYLTRTLTNLSLIDIGDSFGRDHSTVLTSVRKVETMMKSDPEVSGTIRDITSNLNSKQ